MQATVTSKGQVTIPKAVREALGVDAGSIIDFRRNAQGDIVVSKGEAKPASRFDRFVGTATSGLTTEEIMAMTRGED